MPDHDDLDFPHAATWCSACWDEQQRSRHTATMEKANDLKERELDLREHGEWVEPKAAPRPRYVISPPPAPTARGGMSIEPRRRSDS